MSGVLDRGWCIRPDDSGDVHAEDADCRDAGCRRVVVIDIEGDLDPFCRALVEAMYAAGDRASAVSCGVHPATAKAALRSLITPPKPEEPTGLGAVVEDDREARWIRIWGRGIATAWIGCPGDDEPDAIVKWDDIDAVKILSEGVQ